MRCVQGNFLCSCNTFAHSALHFCIYSLNSSFSADPNLNLIERVWKFTKGELRSKYFDNFALFRGRIDAIIESTEKENKAKIDRLIGEKVQLDDMLFLNENTYCWDCKAGSVAKWLENISTCAVGMKVQIFAIFVEFQNGFVDKIFSILCDQSESRQSWRSKTDVRWRKCVFSALVRPIQPHRSKFFLNIPHCSWKCAIICNRVDSILIYANMLLEWYF